MQNRHALEAVRHRVLDQPLEAGALVTVDIAGGQPPRDLALQVSVAMCLAVAVGSFFAVEPLISLPTQLHVRCRSTD
jgi:hypothetical protein